MGEVGALELQAAKYGRLNRSDVLDSILDELSFKKKEREILEQIGFEVFGGSLESIRDVSYKLQAALEQYEELLLETRRAEIAFEILKASGILGENTETQKTLDALASEVSQLESQVKANLNLIEGIIPSAFNKFLEETNE